VFVKWRGIECEFDGWVYAIAAIDWLGSLKLTSEQKEKIGLVANHDPLFVYLIRFCPIKAD